MSEKLSLKTQRLIISPLSVEETESLYDNESDPELRAAYGEMLSNTKALPGKKAWGAYWNIKLLNGEKVGGLCFMGAPDERGSVELGYGIDEEYRHCGFATEAVAAVSDWALTQSDVSFVNAQTAPDNIFSQKVLTVNGFIRNGFGDEGCLFTKAKK